MVNRVHIEGMGWYGAVAATLCERLGIDFTWHDTDDPVRNAWRASTGIVYPAGDDLTTRTWSAWRDWWAHGRWPDGTVERCSYWFAHKHPPHGGRYPIVEDLGVLRRGEIDAFQVNPAAIVADVRARHAAARLDGPPRRRPDRYIVAHGFDRADRVVWGWTRLVRLVFDPALAADRRPTFYTRKGRFLLAYAYAIPGRPGWYWAGSSLIVQPAADPHRLDAAKHYRRWREAFKENTAPLVDVAEEGDLIEGWRPRGPSDSTRVVARDGGRTLVVPPLWHSGVRWAPEVESQLAEALTR